MFIAGQPVVINLIEIHSAVMMLKQADKQAEGNMFLPIMRLFYALIST
jgi:hypothetical protein